MIRRLPDWIGGLLLFVVLTGVPFLYLFQKERLAEAGMTWGQWIWTQVGRFM